MGHATSALPENEREPDTSQAIQRGDSLQTAEADRAQAGKNIAAGLLPPLSAEELAFVDNLVAPGKGRKIWPA